MSSSTFNSDTAFEHGGHTFRFPHGLLIAVVGIVAIELIASNASAAFDRNAIFIPDDRVPNLVETIVDAKLNLSNQPGPHYEILILGDSSGLMGVDPRQLSEIVGQSVFNLCTVSLMGVEAHLRCLEKFVETHGAPSLVVYHFAPSELHYTNDDLIAWGYRIGVQRWFADVNNEPVPKDVESRSSSKHPAENSVEDRLVPLPSQKFRDVSRKRLSLISSRARYRSKPRGAWPSHDEVSDRIIKQNGFLQEVHKSGQSKPTDLVLGFSNHYQKGIDLLLAECQRRGIEVLIVANPLPDYTQTSVTLTKLEVQKQLIDEIANRYANASVLFPDQRFFANDQFATLTHLRPSAAWINTPKIGDRMLQKTTGLQGLGP